MKWTGNWSGKLNRKSPCGEMFLSGRSDGKFCPKTKPEWSPCTSWRGLPIFISQPSSSSQSKQKARFPSSAHHILRAQRVVYIGTRQSFQKWALRNKGTLFCDVILLNGFCSEISEVLFSKGASKESCQLLAHSEEGLATHHITLSIHKETKRRQ